MRTLLAHIFWLTVYAADWPQLRGPDGSGLCPTCGPFPTEFGAAKNILWKTEIPEGKSSPVLAGDRIFLTAAEGDDLITLCLNRSTGKVQWRRSVRAAKREFQHTLNHRAAPTPVTDGQSLYVFFADFGLVSYDFEGKQRWQLPLGPFNSLHGVAASPIYADGKIILVCDQDTDGYIVAVNAATGQIAWKTPRDVSNGYATPVLYRPPHGPAQIIAPGSYQLTGYSVADGKPIWFVRGLTCQPKSAPTIANDVVYFNGWTPGNLGRCDYFFEVSLTGSTRIVPLKRSVSTRGSLGMRIMFFDGFRTMSRNVFSPTQRRIGKSTSVARRRTRSPFRVRSNRPRLLPDSD